MKIHGGAERVSWAGCSPQEASFPHSSIQNSFNWHNLLFSLCVRQHICTFMWHPWLYGNGKNLISNFKVTAPRRGSQVVVEHNRTQKQDPGEKRRWGRGSETAGRRPSPCWAVAVGTGIQRRGVLLSVWIPPKWGLENPSEGHIPEEGAHRWAGEA